MSKAIVKKILDHPDKDEIIGKLAIGISSADVSSWLSGKYTNVSESKFVLSEKNIETFRKDYLDVYAMIREDTLKAKDALATSTEDQMQLSIKNNSLYKSRMLELAGKELDIRTIVHNLCICVENRLSVVFDTIMSDPSNINTRLDRLLIDYTEALGAALDRYYKYTEGPTTQITNNNITVQVIDKHISIIQDTIKDVLQEMDLEASLLFMELFNERMSKLKLPTEKDIPKTEVRLAEAKLLNETITQKLNE